MPTRRDVCVALGAVLATMAAVVWAQSPMSPLLKSSVFNWEEIPVAKTSSGEKRVFFRAKTATLDQLAVHVTTVGPHMQAHDPHRHWEEELIIVKEGTIESMQNGEKTVVGPGSILFEASGELHGLKNAGDTPASYYVIKWWPPGTLDGAAE